MGLFLVITFLLPLLSITIQNSITNTGIRLIFYGIEAALPSIAAIIILMINKNGKEFCRKMFHKKYLGIAVFLPIIACLTVGLAKLIFCLWFKVNFVLGSILAMQLLIIAWAFIAEEIGGRGYWESLLRKRGINKEVVSFITGIIWCLWHYHYFLQNGVQVPIL